MNTTSFILIALLALTGLARSEDVKIDIERAKEIHQKQKAGTALTAEEQKYLDDAKRQFESKNKPANLEGLDIERLKALHERVQKGETLSADDQKYYDHAKRRAGSGGNPQAKPNEGFDWERAKALHQRVQGGETLSADDQKYYDEAKQRMQSGKGPGGDQKSPPNDGFDWKRAKEIYDKNQKGETLSAEEKSILDEAMKRRGQGGSGKPEGRKAELPKDAKPAAAATNLVPLTELTASYLGRDGGLYGGGKNDPPAAQQALISKALADIKPLDSSGKAGADGKIVMISIGMSNTTQEFSAFVSLANGDSRKADNLVIVDCAQGGQTARAWSASDANAWSVAEQRLKQAGMSPQQVQVVWIKQANAGPREGTDIEMKRLQDDMEKVVQNVKQKYPNAKLAFLSSRIYAGYAQTGLNPEPYAYEGAFAMRDLIQKQTSGDAALGADKSPVLLWGPYLWGAGPTPRKADALIWLPEDFSGDGTHPSNSGREKVARVLLEFFTTNANAKPWFTKKA
jgi:ribosome assembly protein YihI (activator of Der GTPase)